VATSLKGIFERKIASPKAGTTKVPSRENPLGERGIPTKREKKKPPLEANEEGVAHKKQRSRREKARLKSSI